MRVGNLNWMSGYWSSKASKNDLHECTQQWLYTKSTLVKNASYLIMYKIKNICQTKQYNNCCCTDAINLCDENGWVCK